MQPLAMVSTNLLFKIQTSLTWVSVAGSCSRSHSCRPNSSSAMPWLTGDPGFCREEQCKRQMLSTEERPTALFLNCVFAFVLHTSIHVAPL